MSSLQMGKDASNITSDVYVGGDTGEREQNTEKERKLW